MTKRTALRRLPWALLLLAGIALGAVLGPVLGPERETVWEGQALLRANPAPVSGSGTASDAATLAASAAAAATTPQVEEAVSATRLAAPLTDVRASVRPGTALVAILADSSDRTAAAAGARAYALALRTLRTASDRRQYRRAATLLRASVPDGARRLPEETAAQVAALESAARSALPLAVVRLGTVRERSSGPTTAVASAVGAAAGLLLAAVLLLAVVGWRRRGRRVVSLPALRAGSSKAPVLGAVPPLRTYRGRGRGRAFSILPDELETFRMVRRALRDVGPEGAQVVLVTSAQPGAGKSTVAVGLAAAAAEAGERALVVECDLRVPSLAARLGLRPGPGLAEYVAGACEPRATLQETSLPGPSGTTSPFWVVTAGAARVASHRLEGAEIAEMLRHVRDGYDVVLLDAPPLVGAVDAGYLVPQADVVALCARLGQVTGPALDTAIDLAGRAGDPDRVGVVATDVRSSRDPAGETVIYGTGRR